MNPRRLARISCLVAITLCPLRAWAEPFIYLPFTDSREKTERVQEVIVIKDRPIVNRLMDLSGKQPYRAIAAHPSGRYVYLADGAGTLSTPLASLASRDTALVGDLKGVATSPDGRYLYVTSITAETLTVLDATQSPPPVVATIPAGKQPWGVAASPDGNRVYVTNHLLGAGTLTVFDTTKDPKSPLKPALIPTVSVGSLPIGVAVRADSRYVYVANYGGTTVSAVNTATLKVTKTVDVGFSNPYGIALSPMLDRAPDIAYVTPMLDIAYVTSLATNKVGMILVEGDDPKWYGSRTVGEKFTSGISIHPDPSNPRVYVISGDSKLYTLDVLGNILDSGAIDPATHDVLGNFIAEKRPILSITPSPLDFGPVRVGKSSGKHGLTLKNSGSLPFTTKSVSPYGPEIAYDSFTSACENENGLMPGEDCIITYLFSPKTPGKKSVDVTWTDTYGNQTTATFIGEGIQPEVSLSRTGEIVFPDTVLNELSPFQKVTITNTGTDMLTVGNVAVSGDFTQANDCSQPVAPQASCPININFNPKGILLRKGTLTITDDAPGSPRTLILKGSGIVPSRPSPLVYMDRESLNFSETVLGQASPFQTITIKNIGTAPLPVGLVGLEGQNVRDFILDGSNCSSKEIQAGASCTISVKFRPTAATDRTATLMIHDGAEGSPRKVSLKGTGLPIGGYTTCGNGILEGLEECDEGVKNSDTASDVCRTNCTKARCGDFVLDAGEECDDGNNKNGDLCGATCKKEASSGSTTGIAHAAPPEPLSNGETGSADSSPAGDTKQSAPGLSGGCSLIPSND